MAARRSRANTGDHVATVEPSGVESARSGDVSLLRLLLWLRALRSHSRASQPKPAAGRFIWWVIIPLFKDLGRSASRKHPALAARLVRAVYSMSSQAALHSKEIECE